jgi:hypothetical protein
MNSNTIPNTELNSNQVFIFQKSELEKRLDLFSLLSDKSGDKLYFFTLD